MKKTAILIVKAVLSIIYGFLKLLPVKNRIVFMSRQSNNPSYDIMRLVGFCAEKGIETKVLCRKLDNNARSAISYAFHILVQMYYMATSKVLVLDSYCIAACLLKHKKDLSIVQMWHALGSMKKFSMSILDQKEGHSSALAKSMHMHENYDYIFTSGEASRGAFAEAFGYPAEKLTVMSLPRVDALMDGARDREVGARILEAYPQLKEKKTILYAPTLRKNYDMTEAAGRFMKAVDYDKYNLVIKMHPLTKGDIDPGRAVIDRKFSTMDMFSVCDYVVTDYSAITYEAALKGLPLFFYAFDLDDYQGDRSFYFDYETTVPGPVCRDAESIIRAIENGSYDLAEVRAFADKYVEKQSGCTREIGEILMGLL